MADYTLNVLDIFGPDTQVDVYPATNWPLAADPPEGQPRGDSYGSGAKVDPGKGAQLTGLEPHTVYYAHAEVDGVHRYVRFKTRG